MWTQSSAALKKHLQAYENTSSSENDLEKDANDLEMKSKTKLIRLKVTCNYNCN